MLDSIELGLFWKINEENEKFKKISIFPAGNHIAENVFEHLDGPIR